MGDVKIMDLDVRVGEGVKPAAEELGTGRLSCAGHPAWRPQDDVVGERVGKAGEVMGIEGFRLLVERLAYGHCHRNPFRQIDRAMVLAHRAHVQPICRARGDCVRPGGPVPGLPPATVYTRPKKGLKARRLACRRLSVDFSHVGKESRAPTELLRGHGLIGEAAFRGRL